eukprot:ANDGO_01731.mRNA.1 hypothetical protein
MSQAMMMSPSYEGSSLALLRAAVLSHLPDEESCQKYLSLLRSFFLAKVSVSEMHDVLTTQLFTDAPGGLVAHNRYLFGILLAARTAPNQLPSRDAAFEQLQKLHAAIHSSQRQAQVTIVPPTESSPLDARLRKRIEALFQLADNPTQPAMSVDDQVLPFLRLAVESHIKDLIMRMISFASSSVIRIDELLCMVVADGSDLLGDEAVAEREKVLALQRVSRGVRDRRLEWISRE